MKRMKAGIEKRGEKGLGGLRGFHMTLCVGARAAAATPKGEAKEFPLLLRPWRGDMPRREFSTSSNKCVVRVFWTYGKADTVGLPLLLLPSLLLQRLGSLGVTVVGLACRRGSGCELRVLACRCCCCSSWLWLTRGYMVCSCCCSCSSKPRGVLLRHCVNSTLLLVTPYYRDHSVWRYVMH